MARTNDDVRMEFIGDVVRHTEDGVVHCNAEPTVGKVDYRDHDCQEEMVAGDDLILFYEKRDDEKEWFQKFRFCASCNQARKLPEKGRERGKEQAIVEGTLEQFEGVVEGEFYEDAVRLVDVNVIAHSPTHEG